MGVIVGKLKETVLLNRSQAERCEVDWYGVEGLSGGNTPDVFHWILSERMRRENDPDTEDGTSTLH
jgi:hypothetical protein